LVVKQVKRKVLQRSTDFRNNITLDFTANLKAVTYFVTVGAITCNKN
jgi:ribosomal protein S17E